MVPAGCTYELGLSILTLGQTLSRIKSVQLDTTFEFIAWRLVFGVLTGMLAAKVFVTPRALKQPIVDRQTAAGTHR